MVFSVPCSSSTSSLNCNPSQSSFQRYRPIVNGHYYSPSSQYRNPEGCATALLALLRSARIFSYLPKTERVAHGPECLLGASDVLGHGCRTPLLRCGCGHRKSVHTPLLPVNTRSYCLSVRLAATVAYYYLKDASSAILCAAKHVRTICVGFGVCYVSIYNG